ncbi:MAG: hypothetical protein FJ087_08005 [Deltaproteobacteria bacterium]|nr:hypothetical protein [Deltaproteobacteria bacterium]
MSEHAAELIPVSDCPACERPLRPHAPVVTVSPADVLRVVDHFRGEACPHQVQQAMRRIGAAAEAAGGYEAMRREDVTCTR